VTFLVTVLSLPAAYNCRGKEPVPTFEDGDDEQQYLL